jgi:hypothetical protein
MKIAIHAFKGARPIVQPFNLQDNEASHCVDCYFQSSGLDPLKSGKFIARGFTGAKTIYRIDDQYISLYDVIDIVRSPIIQDKHRRLYFTTATGKKDLYESVESDFAKVFIRGRRLRDLLPPNHYASYNPGEKRQRKARDIAPFGVMTLLEGVEDEKNANPSYKYATFRITFVTDRGEETAPGMASDEVEYIDDKTKYGILLSDLPISDSSWVVSRRIYVAIDGGDFYLIDEIDNNVDTTYIIAPFDDDAITDLLITEDWDPVPENLTGLCGLPNGVLAGFLNDKNTGTIRLSFPFQPHAWPVDYSFKSLYKIVALLAVPEGLLVLTEGKPMLITGSTPDLMQEHVIESSDSCQSALSAVVSGGVAYWSSADGLAAFGGLQVKILSKNTWSRDQWQALNPRKMHFQVYEDHLLIYANDADKAFIYSLQRHDISELSQTGIECGLYDLVDDKLLLVDGDDLIAFNEGDYNLSATWESKHYIQTHARPYSSARIVADAYPLSFELLPEGNEGFFQKVIENDKPFRVKSTGRKRWQKIRIATPKRVNSLQVTITMQEIV